MSGGAIRRGARVALGLLACGVLTGCFSSPPQIISLDPNRGSVGVPADSPIVVQFDRPVVPRTVVGRFDVSPPISGCDLDQAFGAPPGAACRIVWLSGDTGFALQHPGTVLASNKQYTFILRGGFADPEGAVNTVDHRWNITTASAPEVRAITPATGSANVPDDLPLSVTFSSAMAQDSTRQAITLSPSVPGTRVVSNSKDASRFLLLPGHPLQPGVTYRLSIAVSATDLHGQGLLAPASSTFVAGGISPGPHAVVLAGTGSQDATQVYIAALTAAVAGDPIAAESVLQAATCPAPACGAVPSGAPLYTYRSATLSQNGAWLAAVEQDRTSPQSQPAVVVVNGASGAVATVIQNAVLPSWSPDGTTLAYEQGATVQLYHPAGGAIDALPPGDPLLTAPVWEPRGELLVLNSQSPAGAPAVELADALVDARYPVPGLSGENTDPAVSPDGTQLAVFRPGASDGGAWIVGIGAGVGAPPRRLDADVAPLGWTDSGTLLAVRGASSPHPSLVQVSVAGGGQLSVAPAPPVASLSSISVSSSGRLFGFLQPDAAGVVQARVESIEGGSTVPVTAFEAGTVDAVAVTLS